MQFKSSTSWEVSFTPGSSDLGSENYSGQWGIWQLQRITCIMTRLSKASPRHHSACSQENQKSTCAVEGFFSHSLKPSPERIEITLSGWGNRHIFNGKKDCIIWNHLHPWIRPAALAAGTARCHVVTVVCGMPWQSQVIQFVKGIFNWKLRTLGIPGSSLSRSTAASFLWDSSHIATWKSEEIWWQVTASIRSRTQVLWWLHRTSPRTNCTDASTGPMGQWM